MSNKKQYGLIEYVHALIFMMFRALTRLIKLDCDNKIGKKQRHGLNIYNTKNIIGIR